MPTPFMAVVTAVGTAAVAPTVSGVALCLRGPHPYESAIGITTNDAAPIEIESTDRRAMDREDSAPHEEAFDQRALRRVSERSGTEQVPLRDPLEGRRFSVGTSTIRGSSPSPLRA